MLLTTLFAAVLAADQVKNPACEGGRCYNILSLDSAKNKAVMTSKFVEYLE